MDFSDLLSAVSSAIGIIFVLILSFINIPKLDINIWGIIGKNLTREAISKIDNLENRIENIDLKLDSHITEDEVDKVKLSRLRILIFGSDILNGIKPTREHEEDILDSITEYEKYCISHPDFKNNKADITINFIKKDYENRLLTDNFN